MEKEASLRESERSSVTVVGAAESRRLLRRGVAVAAAVALERREVGVATEGVAAAIPEEEETLVVELAVAAGDRIDERALEGELELELGLVRLRLLGIENP